MSIVDNRKKKRRNWIIALIVLVVLVLIFSGLFKRKEKAKRRGSDHRKS